LSCLFFADETWAHICFECSRVSKLRGRIIVVRDIRARPCSSSEHIIAMPLINTFVSVWLFISFFQTIFDSYSNNKSHTCVATTLFRPFFVFKRCVCVWGGGEERGVILSSLAHSLYAHHSRARYPLIRFKFIKTRDDNERT